MKPQILQLASVHRDREVVDFHDEESLLHINHIRSGEIGQWQQELSEKEVNLIEKKFEEWCRSNHFFTLNFSAIKQVIFLRLFASAMNSNAP